MWKVFGKTQPISTRCLKYLRDSAAATADSTEAERSPPAACTCWHLLSVLLCALALAAKESGLMALTVNLGILAHSQVPRMLLQARAARKWSSRQISPPLLFACWRPSARKMALQGVAAVRKYHKVKVNLKHLKKLHIFS